MPQIVCTGVFSECILVVDCLVGEDHLGLLRALAGLSGCVALVFTNCDILLLRLLAAPRLGRSRSAADGLMSLTTAALIGSWHTGTAVPEGLQLCPAASVVCVPRTTCVLACTQVNERVSRVHPSSREGNRVRPLLWGSP